MVKRTKRHNKRRQKGGLWGFFEEEKVEGTGTGTETETVNNGATTDSGYFSNFKMPEVSNPFASNPSTTDPATTDSGYFSNFKMPEISNPFASTPAPPPNPNYPLPNPNPNYSDPANPAPIGGRRRKKHMRGGIGSSRGLGLTYYASPVNGIKVAEPTYMEFYKGGSRRRSRKCKRRKKCNKTCRKSHRHYRR
jgi:hypothetical protein